MRLRFLFFLFVSVLFGLTAHAQRIVGQDTLYGNEWLEAGVEYVNLGIVKTDIYRVDYASLQAFGWNSIEGSDLRLFLYGEQVPIEVSNDGTWQQGDYLLFFGEYDAKAIDEAELYPSGAAGMLNTDYPNFDDTLTYVLARNTSLAPLRYQEEVASIPSAGASDLVQVSVKPSVLPSRYDKRSYDSFGSSYSTFQDGEGWAYGNSTRTLVRLDAPFYTSGEAILHLRTRASFPSDFARIRRLSVNGTAIRIDTLSANELSVNRIDVSNQLQSSQRLDLIVEGIGAGADRYSVGSVSLRCDVNCVVPEILDKEFTVKSSETRISGLDEFQDYTLIDYQSQKIFHISGRDTVSVLSSSRHRLFLKLDQQLAAPTIRAFTSELFIDASSNYLIVGSEVMENWNTSPADYANMRAEPSMDGYRPTVWHIEDIYDVFGYGQDKDPRALQRAILSAKRFSAVNQVLLIGKAREFDLIRTPAREANPSNSTAFLPVYGKPGADNPFVFNTLTNAYEVAIGRLPVETSEELDECMNKVRAVSSIAPLGATTLPKWAKRVIHLGGGDGASEQALIKNLLQTLAGNLDDTPFAPFFLAKYKDSNQPIQAFDNQEVYDALSEGNSILTAFGHGSSTNFDFAIDDPLKFQNPGRYPVVLALGCYSGGVSQEFKSIGERFVLSPSSGSVIYGSTVGLGFPTALYRHTRTLYETYGNMRTSSPIGEAFLAAANASKLIPGYINQILADQFLFQGDPAVRMYRIATPDYIIDEERVEVDAPLSSNSNVPITVDLTVLNLGAEMVDSVVILIERKSEIRPRQVVDSFTISISTYSTSTQRQLESWTEEGGGLNSLWLSVSSRNGLEVGDALLNDLSQPINFFIPDNSIDLLYPFPREVLAAAPDSFLVTTRRPFDQAAEYVLQVSSGADFQNIQFESTVSGQGLLMFEASSLSPGSYVWRVANTLSDSIAYGNVGHFQIRADSSGSNARKRYELADRESWLTESTFDGLNIRPDGTWTFDSTGFFLSVKTRMSGPAGRPVISYDFASRGQTVFSFPDALPGMLVLVYNPSEGTFRSSTDSSAIGSWATSNVRVMQWPTKSREGRQDLIRYLREEVPRGAYVLLASAYEQSGPRSELDFADWFSDSTDANLPTLSGFLMSEGAQLVNDWVTRPFTSPWHMVYIKGREVILEDLGQDREDEIRGETFIQTLGTQGSIRTAQLPPAQSLHSLICSSQGGDVGGSVRLSGIQANRDTVLLTQGTYNEELVLDSLDVEDYEHLLFEVVQQADSLNKQVRALQLGISYTPKAELVFDPLAYLEYTQDTLVLGQKDTFSVAIRNVGGAMNQRTTIELSAIDGSSTAGLVDLPLLASGEADTVRFSTVPLRLALSPGDIVEINAAELPEWIEGNNRSSISFSSKRDESAPLLRLYHNDQLVEGTGLLVSEPVFYIQLLDDFGVGLAAKENLSISLVKPDGTRLAGGESPSTVELVSSNESGNAGAVARFQYDAGELPDGVYGLEISYQPVSPFERASRMKTIGFELVTSTSISSFIPYPNPFTSKAYFQYEFTGVETVDFQIDIYTTTGRLVRSLGGAELGMLKVGRHLTDGYWDGTDQFGQKLARGVYLYKVSSLAGGERVEQRQTSIDTYISKKGFGKIVLLQ